MKKILTIILPLLAISAIYAFNNSQTEPVTGIQFYNGSFEDAINNAKKENKLIFLDIYATWCGPCKKLKANTFTNKEVSEFYNKTFINMELDGEKGEGLLLAKKYGVKGYPTLLFIDTNGTIVSETAGYYNSSEFLTLGKSISLKK
jgi:thiol:disulfide interchange protein